MNMYVVGFVFDIAFENVLLLHKKRPDWQNGRLNGCGGKVESGEEGTAAMARECLEETGLVIPKESWTKVAMLRGGEDGVPPDNGPYAVSFYFAVADVHQAKTTTDEFVAVVSTRELPEWNTTMHVQWMVPLCKAFVKGLNGMVIAMPLLVREERQHA